MDAGTGIHLAGLKEALHTLKDSGADGFEGLLAAVLSEICGQPFRLASSGSQRGRDGDSAFDSGSTYFEAKLYQGDVPRSTVSNKLLELSIDDKGQVDTWALCATSAISAQHAVLYRDSLTKSGIGCLILDWPDHTLPTLATLLAMAPATTEQFLKDHSTVKPKVADVRRHLDGIAADSQFPSNSDSLRGVLNEPLLGLGLAKAANKAWLLSAFSDRKRARQFFGQPLAPLDATGLAWAERTALVGELAGAFSGAPGEAVYLVIGDEGTGKSWLVAKGWSVASPQPLLVVFTADELKMPMAMHDIEGLLIEKLAQQTGDTLTDAAKLRWQRRLKGWRANPNPANIRLAVWVDGLNQAQDFPWPRWIDATAKVLAELGGRLIITTNLRHFAQRLRGIVVSQLRRVNVSEWSEAELRTILAGKGIDSDKLSGEVFNFLRNPRILWIAVELLDRKDIERFEQLTVGRLLFEHIRRCERDGTTDIPALDFARALRSHADEIVGRLSSQQRDDIKLFDVPLDDRLKAVSQSRFFETVPGDAGLYAIRDEGLPLALGLSLLNALLKEERNKRNPADRLSEIVEPILALAKTSEVIFSALLVASLDPDCPVAVTAALARYYVSLQNLDEALWPAFESLVKAAPAAFTQAASDAALSGSHLANMKWLTFALLGARALQANKANIFTPVTSWLSFYSLSPERLMFVHANRDPREKVEAERAKRKAELDKKLSELSSNEKAFIETRLIRNDAKGLSNLHFLAFELLAGMPLSGFSDALVNWAFSDALNTSLHAPNSQFEHLIRFNTVDWQKTREALLKSSEALTTEGISRTGEWALVAVLRATGHPDDAARAEALVERLTKDRERFGAWRLVEKYSETDPCDPGSAKPGNIDGTAKDYEALDVSKLRLGMGNTVQDHFFSDARPGLVRFHPGTAIAVQRKFARQVTERDGFSKRQGMLALLPSAAILETDVVDRLIAFAQSENATAYDASSDERDLWLTAQYALRAALPHKSGNEQLAIIAALPGRSLLLSLLEQVSPADEPAVEAHLERVLQSGDPAAQSRVLSFVHYSRSPVSARGRQILAQLLQSADRMVRSQALAISVDLRDGVLLKQIVDSGWDATRLDQKENYYELWYGSSALLAAAEAGIVDPASIVGRLAIGFYNFAVRRLSADGAATAMARIDDALKTAANVKAIPELPLVEQPVSSDQDRTPPLLSLVDKPVSSDIRHVFDRLSETDAAYQERQKQDWQTFDRFSNELTAADARLILDDVAWDGFDAIVASKPALAKSWLALLSNVSGSTLSSLHFFALGLAAATAKIDAAGSASLFRRLSTEAALVNRVVGPSKIPAEAIAVWSQASVPEIKQLCFERLDRAANDADLAVEVLAALSEKKHAEINEYVRLKLAIREPIATARALMVSGFSDCNAEATDVLKQFAGYTGFIGQAYKAARYAYDRNNWARHWFEKMKSAQIPEEFWRFAVLFAKLVDGRYALWRNEFGAPARPFELFFLTIEDRMESRIKNWHDKRLKKLFGQNVPEPIFLCTP